MAENKSNKDNTTLVKSSNATSGMTKAGNDADVLLRSLNSLAALKEYSQAILASALTPLDTANDVMNAILMGRELGLSPMTSVQNIYPVKGRASLGINIIRDRLLKNGIPTKVIKDYEPVYSYYDKNKTQFPEDMVLDMVSKGKWQFLEAKYVKNPDVVGALDPNKKTIIRQTVDRVTTVYMKRKILAPDGNWEVVEVEVSYYYSTAQRSDLIKPKSAWEKDPQNQMMVRATSKAARTIAADLLNGHYEAGEFLDSQQVDYDLGEDGEPIIEAEVITDTNESSIPEEKETATPVNKS